MVANPLFFCRRVVPTCRKLMCRRGGVPDLQNVIKDSALGTMLRPHYTDLEDVARYSVA